MNCPYGKSRVLRLFCGSPKLVKKIEGWVSRRQTPLTSSRETFDAPTHDGNSSSTYANIDFY
ncbi:hypothetical protein NIES4074_46320 [Cylindrospermum sp. NIES-4074]|nr:hypothetical protein NIES4074_46320 [Cylindrospermum sp. NIES-4074]